MSARDGRAKEPAGKRSNAVILSSSEGSRSAFRQGSARFFVSCWLLRMTIQLGFPQPVKPCPSKNW
jgi:hypothetical protein